jgi:hypothetical protein
MRQEELNKLKEPYTQPRSLLDRRFESALGADVPSACRLATEILNDLDEKDFGISWWSSVPVEERILISDYLYQCVDGIEKNLVEAKLHYFEWLDARDRSNDFIVDSIKIDLNGEPYQKLPPVKAPIEELPNALEGMHLCGFFQSIGSSLDCLGGVIIGVLGLKWQLRKNDIGKAKQTLTNIKNPKTPGELLQVEFRDFFESQIVSSGPEDWLEWADQYRNMFVHRGRRLTTNQTRRREGLLYKASGEEYLRATSTLHLAKHPDKTDIEALVKKDMMLNEDADTTFKGIFKSCRDLNESVCERLLSIWIDRRNNPSLIEQPATQWNPNFRACKFSGYDPNAEPLGADLMTGHPILHHRMLAASADDQHRAGVWANSPWSK